jgi:hypothetical protein
VNETLVRILVYAVRVATALVQGALAFLGARFYYKLTEESPKMLLMRLNPLPALRTIGITSTISIILAALLGVRVSEIDWNQPLGASFLRS